MLPITVWEHLELLAIDSREVRTLYQVDTTELRGQRDRSLWRSGYLGAALEDERRRHRRELVAVCGGTVAVLTAATWAIISTYRAGFEAGLVVAP